MKKGDLVWFKYVLDFVTMESVTMVGEVLSEERWTTLPGRKWEAEEVFIQALDGSRHFKRIDQLTLCAVRGEDDMATEEPPLGRPLIVGELVWMKDNRVAKVTEYDESNERGYQVRCRWIDDDLTMVYTMRKFVEPCAVK